MRDLLCAVGCAVRARGRARGCGSRVQVKIVALGQSFGFRAKNTEREQLKLSVKRYASVNIESSK